MSYQLSQPIETIDRIGVATAKKLNKLGIETISDLIFYYPVRWQDYSNISKISELKLGEMATIKAVVQKITVKNIYKIRKSLVEAVVDDSGYLLKVVWFNQPYIASQLTVGTEVYLTGKTSNDKYGFQMVSPTYEKVAPRQPIHTARIVPVYSSTASITQKQLRFYISQVMPVINSVEEILPNDILKQHQLLNRRDALRNIHFPESLEMLKKSQNTLGFEELFLFMVKVISQKQVLKKSAATPVIFSEKKTLEFVEKLPFKLTQDQRRAAWEIIKDISQNTPMSRLLEGDVGSGKTVVAGIAMLNVAVGEGQSLMMAPTEILAIQHYKTLSGLFKKTKINVCLLTSKNSIFNGKKITKLELLKKINLGKAKVIIGTHALLQQKVDFDNLVLAVVDEQHRFGVAQRNSFLKKKNNQNILPHLLAMTATPIPRSLALTLYGDLDLSIIKTKPLDRKKILTKIVTQDNRKKMYDFIKAEIENGRQAYIICPLIDPSDKLGVKAATDEYRRIKIEVFKNYRVGLLHGKLNSNEKQKVLTDFNERALDILVCTSVVEVGIDVPNATIMVIENAERFGLSQLHQIRGRVGRSSHQSYCLLFVESNSEKTIQRMDAFVLAKDGFELAEYDLRFRGFGELAGTEQSGWKKFKIADITKVELLKKVKTAAQFIVEKGLDNYPHIKKNIEAENEKNTESYST